MDYYSFNLPFKLETMIQKQRDLLSNAHGLAVIYQTKKQIRDKSNSFVHYLNSSGNKNDVTKILPNNSRSKEIPSKYQWF